MKIIFLIFQFFLINAAVAASHCQLETSQYIYKINKAQDSSIIKETNCDQKTIHNFINFISNVEGELKANYLEKYFLSEFETTIKVKPESLNIYDLKTVFQKDLDKTFIIKSITSLHNSSALAFKFKPFFETNCSQCSKAGTRNLSLKVNSNTIWFTLNLQKIKKGFRATRSMNANSKSLSISQLEEVTITESNDTPLFTDLENLKYYKTNRAISKGELLRQNHLSPIDIVRSGKQVKLLLRRSGLSLKTTAISRSNGKIGDIISVMNPKSKKVLSAKVININTVMVEL